MDRARSLDGEIDRESDRRMLARAAAGPGVFDSWALPWLYEGSDAIRVWIDATMEARVERCLLSAAARGNPAPPDPVALLESKDSFSRDRFRDLYDFELEGSSATFDVVAENSRLMNELSPSRAEADADRFHRKLARSIDRVWEARAVEGRSLPAESLPSPERVVSLHDAEPFGEVDT